MKIIAAAAARIANKKKQQKFGGGGEGEPAFASFIQYKCLPFFLVAGARGPVTDPPLGAKMGEERGGGGGVLF